MRTEKQNEQRKFLVIVNRLDEGKVVDSASIPIYDNVSFEKLVTSVTKFIEKLEL